MLSTASRTFKVCSNLPFAFTRMWQISAFSSTGSSKYLLPCSAMTIAWAGLRKCMLSFCCAVAVPPAIRKAAIRIAYLRFLNVFIILLLFI